MAWLLACLIIGSYLPVRASSTHPYYRRSKPVAQNVDYFSRVRYPIFLTNTNIHLDPYVVGSFNLSAFTNRFDARAAAAVSSALAPAEAIRFGPSDEPDTDLLELNNYKDHVPGILIPKKKCLAVMAYPDFFPGQPANDTRRALVSDAILISGPGWCGTFGPGVEADDLILDGAVPLIDFGEVPEGNYDMAQMHLLMLAYRYYDELTPAAREHLINQLLQNGRIHRPGHDDMNTSGAVPVDWPRAGTIKMPVVGNDIRQIGETENHILMIHTTRYLCNQLLYQRTHQSVHDNRRNGSNGGPACTDLVLALLRNILRGDFSEYNSKNYQKETRWALLNLCSFAYDHEVRLAARMVLDYYSARFAVSSSDLRRMVPFRRKNEHPKNRTVGRENGGFMDVGLVDWQLGADVMTRIFILLTGNTRALASGNFEWASGTELAMRPWDWAIADSGHDFLIDVLSDYRLPPSIHDLFVNDPHRRFFQRLHRTPRPEELGGNRNVDNMEINAGSPSYLITAGGAPAEQAIPGFLIFGNIRSDRGVAVSTSFMPTGESAGPMTQNAARELIQFGSFSDDPGEVANYGVAPDFACGYRMYLPPWIRGEVVGQFLFVKQGYVESNRPGFYLAIYRQANGFSLMEAFDTWLHPGLSYDEFKAGVLARNANLNLQSNVEAQYVTQNGNRIRFVIWNDGERDEAEMGARVLRIDYGHGDSFDQIGDAGNVTDKFLNGTVLNSPAEAVVEITNPFLGTTITLDMSDKWRPRRIDENGRVEQAGDNREVWVDFEWTGPTEGDFYRPFNTLGAAADAVANGGVIKIMPGITQETPTLSNKRMTIQAPIGGVIIGAGVQ